MLPNAKSHSDLQKTMKRDPGQDLNYDMGRTITFPMLHLITSLVQWLDGQEPVEAPILIFAPTYRHLDQIYKNLQDNFNSENDRDLVINVLHSSVDIEECIRSMQDAYTGQKQHPRRILLASAIADSSITIPGVTCVIDTCRSLRVSWDGSQHSSQTVWASKSVCDQRKGRTGRTCKGRVFRLLPKGYYLSKLADFETPQLTLSDCRNEAMALLSSTVQDISDCVNLLNKSLDPPPQRVVKKAVNYLKNIGACIETGGQHSRLVATEYGTLLAQLPFTISESRVILTAAQHGYLHEMLLLRSILTIRPSPIVNYFADENKSLAALRRYRFDVDSKDSISVASAQMSAYMYWDAEWNNARRQAAYKLFYQRTDSFLGPEPLGSHLTENGSLDGDIVDVGDDVLIKLAPEYSHRRDCGVWHWTAAVDEAHSQWCRSHEINPTSVRAIADTIDVVFKILFLAKFEPEWLRCCPVEPIWNRREAWAQLGTRTQMLQTVYGTGNEVTLFAKLQEFNNPGEAPAIPKENVIAEFFNPPKRREVCVHFLYGNCTFGDRCRKEHSLHGERPVCKFFQIGKCGKGNKCRFLHLIEDKKAPATSTKLIQARGDPLKPVAPLLSLPVGAIGWFKKNAKRLILLGENNFRFAGALQAMNIPPRMATEYLKVTLPSIQRKFGLDPNRVCDQVDATRVHNNVALVKLGNEICGFSWNFPFTGLDEDEAIHEALIMATFLSLALYFRVSVGLSAQTRPQFALTLQGDQLSRWSVLHSAKRTGWQLSHWMKFDHRDFPGYQPCRANGDTFPYEHGRTYVFKLDMAYILLP